MKRDMNGIQMYGQIAQSHFCKHRSWQRKNWEIAVLSDHIKHESQIQRSKYVCRIKRESEFKSFQKTIFFQIQEKKLIMQFFPIKIK